MNKLDMESKDIVKDNLEYIKERFPEAVTEENGELKLNPDSLIQSLSSVIIDDKKEKYELTWPGKKQAIVEGNTRTTKTLRPLKDKSVNFDKTENIYIEGDNLEALKILQESYLNKIKCIYIDPPYNTGKDFIYNDKFDKSKNEELLESGIIDSEGNRLSTNSQSNGRFHSDWISMMYPRIKLARNLLKDDGVIFISIDDNEQNNLKKICDEIFGENNFVCNFVWRSSKGSGNDGKLLLFEHEYILMYAKNINNIVFKNDAQQIDDSIYNLEDEYVNERGKYCLGKLDRGSKGYVKSLDYGIPAPDGTLVFPNNRKEQFNDGWRWMWSQEKVKWGIENGFIVVKKGKNDEWNVYTKQYAYVDNENKPYVRTKLFKSHIGFDENILNISANSDIKNLFGTSVFSYSKPVALIKKILNMIDLNNEIVLDFFSGSATTAQAVMELNSLGGNIRYILVQLPENCSTNQFAMQNNFDTICDIGEERIRRAANRIKEETNLNIDYGFRVYKIDDSNMKDEFYMTPDRISQEQIKLFEDNIKGDRTPDDLITQVLLNLGLKLDLPIEEKTICGNKVFDVDDGELLACFDDNVNIDIIEEIAKINPRQVVFRDSSFATDQDKVNFEERLKRLSAGTKFNVL